ncbi:hypothetical protein GCM10007977_097450 [Dactylosporangium sucinum]|uniref:Uncharacterized protein n=1 Tax=Dactylosporangium sucinum TaxID=1424081 RepID=A0A917UCK9_9ACTN|nr:hypothetical protein GCM10007977_097450 [Dactylosporangium sucinum]
MSASAAAEFYDDAYDDPHDGWHDDPHDGSYGRVIGSPPADSPPADAASSRSVTRLDPAGRGSGRGSASSRSGSMAEVSVLGSARPGPSVEPGAVAGSASGADVVEPLLSDLSAYHRQDRAEGGQPRTPRRIDRLAVVRAAGLSGVVRPASEHAAEVGTATRTLPVLSGLRALLPGGGLRRGATIAVHTSSVLLALLAAASQAGSWCAVVGLPALSPVAAAEMGIALDRLALVPYPGTEWTTAVAALLDGLDIVVAAPPGPIAPAVAGRLAARARQRGSVLMPAGPWAGADLTVAPVRGAWDGLGAGRGRLRCREMTIQARGRGAAAAPREVTLWLPALEGVLPPVSRPFADRPGERPLVAVGGDGAGRGGRPPAAVGGEDAAGEDGRADEVVALRRVG